MVTKLSSKGQLVIPHEIRAALQLQTGSELQITMVDQSIVLTPLPTKPTFTEVMASLYGSLDGESILETFEAEHRQEFEQDERRIARFMGAPGAAMG